MSCYKRPKVFGEKCLGHGISPSGNTAAILAAEALPCTSAIDPRADVDQLLTANPHRLTLACVSHGGGMADREREERDLAEANQHITNAAGLIHFVQECLERLRMNGAPTKDTEDLLNTLLESFALMKLHRDFIVRTLADLKDSR